MLKFLRTVLIVFLVLITAGAALFAVRSAAAMREIEAELAEPPVVRPALASTSRLEILPLYEAGAADDGLLTGPGVSYLVRTDSAAILFDAGHNPDRLAEAPFLQNLTALGLGWKSIDRVVISHPHPDHVGGVSAWQRRGVDAGDRRLVDMLGEGNIFVPAPVSFQGAVHATIPTLPAPDLATTGVLPFAEVFPLSIIQPKNGEQALVARVEGVGLVLITGCGHPGLETLVERAEMLYGQPVAAVVGGLHYQNAGSAALQPHIQFLQAREPVLVALSPHDSFTPAQQAFADAFGSQYTTLRVGEAVRLP